MTSEVDDPDVKIKQEPENVPEIKIRHISVSNSTNTFPAIKSRAFHTVSGSLPEHVRDLYYRSSKNINFMESLELANLLAEYASTFSVDDMDIGNFTELYHWIPTGDAKPIKQFMRRTPLHFQDEEKKHLDAMFQAGVIQESNSAWSSPVCLVRKRSGGLRYCCDLRKLNAVTIKDSHPLPNID